VSVTLEETRQKEHRHKREMNKKKTGCKTESQRTSYNINWEKNIKEPSTKTSMAKMFIIVKLDLGIRIFVKKKLT
jgi:hypothetical protein